MFINNIKIRRLINSFILCHQAVVNVLEVELFDVELESDKGVTRND